MRTQESTKSPQLIIGCGEKKYQVFLEELSTFLSACKIKLDITGIRDLEAEIHALEECVINATPDDSNAGEMKRHMILLRELIFLFKGMLYEPKE